MDAIHPPVPVFAPVEHGSKLLWAEIFLVVMRTHGPQPERGGNAGESHQYQLLRHETAALYGRNIVTVQGWQFTGVQVCPQRADKAADILCKLGAEHRKPHKTNSSYQSPAKAMSKRNSLA